MHDVALNKQLVARIVGREGSKRKYQIVLRISTTRGQLRIASRGASNRYAGPRTSRFLVPEHAVVDSNAAQADEPSLPRVHGATRSRCVCRTSVSDTQIQNACNFLHASNRATINSGGTQTQDIFGAVRQNSTGLAHGPVTRAQDVAEDAVKAQLRAILANKARSAEL